MGEVYYLSPHFTLDEAKCKDGTPCPVEFIGNAEGVARDVLEIVRVEWGRPLYVVSWFRTPAYNKKKGGAPKSTHLDASGVDFRDKDPKASIELHDLVFELYAAKKLPALGGLGKYPAWVHVDTRKALDGHLRRWLGGGIGSER